MTHIALSVCFLLVMGCSVSTYSDDVQETNLSKDSLNPVSYSPPLQRAETDITTPVFTTSRLQTSPTQTADEYRIRLKPTNSPFIAHQSQIKKDGQASAAAGRKFISSTLPNRHARKEQSKAATVKYENTLGNPSLQASTLSANEYQQEEHLYSSLHLLPQGDNQDYSSPVHQGVSSPPALPPKNSNYSELQTVPIQSANPLNDSPSNMLPPHTPTKAGNPMNAGLNEDHIYFVLDVEGASGRQPQAQQSLANEHLYHTLETISQETSGPPPPPPKGLAQPPPFRPPPPTIIPASSHLPPPFVPPPPPSHDPDDYADVDEDVSIEPTPPLAYLVPTTTAQSHDYDYVDQRDHPSEPFSPANYEQPLTKKNSTKNKVPSHDQHDYDDIDENQNKVPSHDQHDYDDIDENQNKHIVSNHNRSPRRQTDTNSILTFDDSSYDNPVATGFNEDGMDNQKSRGGSQIVRRNSSCRKVKVTLFANNRIKETSTIQRPSIVKYATLPSRSAAHRKNNQSDSPIMNSGSSNNPPSNYDKLLLK